MKSGYHTPKKSDMFHGKCVCQICTCGKDRCPPQSLRVDPKHFESTNKKDYPAWELPKREQLAMTPQRVKAGPTDYQSQYQREFTPQKNQSVNKIYSHQHSTNLTPQRFQGNSEYLEQYQRNNTRITPYKGQQIYNYAPTPQKQSYNSMYREQYQGKSGTRSQPIKPEEVIQTHNDLKLNSNSSYKQDYPAHALQKATLIRPLTSQILTGPSREKQSNYKRDFQQYELARQPECPVRQLPPRQSQSPNKHLYFNSDKKAWE